MHTFACSVACAIPTCGFFDTRFLLMALLIVIRPDGFYGVSLNIINAFWWDFLSSCQTGYSSGCTFSGTLSWLAYSSIGRQNCTSTWHSHRNCPQCAASGFADPSHPDYICPLNKSLYGLKHAPRAWQNCCLPPTSSHLDLSRQSHTYYIVVVRLSSGFWCGLVSYYMLMILFLLHCLLVVFSNVILQHFNKCSLWHMGRFITSCEVSVTCGDDGLFLS